MVYIPNIIYGGRYTLGLSQPINRYPYILETILLF